MKPNSLPLLFASISFLILGGLNLTASDTPTTVEQRLALACSKDADSIYILSIPEDEESPVGYSPGALELMYTTRITIRHFQQTDFGPELLSHLKASEIHKEARNEGRDLRWACIFCDKNRKRLVSIYFDHLGKGEVNGIPITSNGKLVKFLRKKISIK